MSHIVTTGTEIRDKAALAAACSRLSLPPPEHGAAILFTIDATGEIVRLPGWTYPVVIDTEARQVKFDNYGGACGKQEELDKLCRRTLSKRQKSKRVRPATTACLNRFFPTARSK